MARIPNPYFAGPPATQPDTFFGRQDVLRFVDETLASPMHNVIIFHGQRRIGKTSTLHQIARHLGQDYQAVFFDLQSSVASSAHDLFYGLARAITDPLKLSPPERSIFEQDPDVFRSVFLPRLYRQLGHKRLLLLLDEFDALELEASSTDLDVLPFVSTLNRIIQSDDKRIVFLFVVGRRLKDLASQQLQIFRGARDQQITLLGQEDTLQLITRPAQGILTYQDTASERIWSLTSGHPYFTQLICHEIFNRANRQNNPIVTEAQVEAVIDDAINAGQSALQWFWDEVPPVERFTLYTIGQLEVEGGATLDQLLAQRSTHGIQVMDFELRALPDQLVDRQVLKRNFDGRYRFAVELVRRWLVNTHSLAEVTTELTRVAVDEVAKTFFKAGQQAYWSDAIKLAIENFGRALSINPNYVEARLWLARAHAKTDDLLAAINEFVNVERFGGPMQREARLGLANVRAHYGQQLEEERQLEEAIQEYQRVLELDPEHPLANARLSQIFQHQADERLVSEGVATAQPLYEQALQHNPSPNLEQAIKEQLDQYSRAQEEANNWEEAERASHLSAQLMSKADDSKEALLRVRLGWGRWHLEQYKLDAAANVYRRALEETTGPAARRVIENDILRYNQQQVEQNNWQQVETALTLLVELFPDDPENQSRLAYSLCQQGEFFLNHDDIAKAKAAYRRALARDPQNQSLINLIRAGFESYRQARSEDKTVHGRKLVEEAVLALIQLLDQADPQAYQWLAEARSDLSDALRQEGRLAEARAICLQELDDANQVLPLMPEMDQAYRATFWLRLGQIDLDEARFDEAVEHFEQALVNSASAGEIVSGIKAALDTYRRQQEETRRWSLAERALGAMERLLSDDEEVRFWLAETYTTQADWHLRRAIPDLEEARRLARSALDVGLSYTKAGLIAAKIKEYFLAHCLRQEQANPPNWAQAEQAMNSLVSFLPDDDEVHRRLAETRAKQGDWHLTYESQSTVEARRHLLKAAEVYRRALNDLSGDETLIARLKESFRAYQHRQKQLNPPAWSLAEQALQILAELLPHDAKVRQWLASETFAERGAWFLQREAADPIEARTHLAEAKKAYEKAWQATPGDKSTLAVHLQENIRTYRQKQEQVKPPQWDLAEEALAILVTLLPEEAETRRQRAELYATQADWLLQSEAPDLTKVETAYRCALAELPGSEETLAARQQQSFRGYRLKQQQADPPNWAAAEQALVTLTTLLPTHDETHWQWAELYTEWGKWHLQREMGDSPQGEAALAEAERFYRQALAALPGDRSVLLAQIKDDFNAYRLKQVQADPPRWHLAEKAMNLLVDLTLADDEACHQLAEVRASWGQAYLRREQNLPGEAEQSLAEAEGIYRRALASLPGEPAFFTNLIKDDLNLYRLQQEQAAPPRWLLAERALLILAELRPEDEEVQGWLAETRLAQGRYDADEAQSLSGWRRETERAQKFEEAEQAYRHAITSAERRTQLAPTNPLAWQQLAVAQAGLGQLFQARHDELSAQAAYDSSILNWRKALELGAGAARLKEVVSIYVARGDLLLQRGDLAAAKQDYLAANGLSPGDRAWLDEVDRRLQVYQARQKRSGNQNQVVETGELRHQLQPDNPVIWTELAIELVVYGEQFLADNEFELARQQYEWALRPRSQTPALAEDERRRLSGTVVQDVHKFIQRQERANNHRQAEEAQAWLSTANFLTTETSPSLSPRRQLEQQRWGRRLSSRWLVIIIMVVTLALCLGAPLAFGAAGIPEIISLLPRPVATLVAGILLPDTPTATLTPSVIPPTPSTATPTLSLPMPTPTLTKTSLPTPPTNTPSPILPTATSSSSLPTNTPSPVPPTNTPLPTPTELPPPPPLPSSSLASAELVNPSNGAVFLGVDDQPRLEWRPIDELSTDNDYVVVLSFSANGQPMLYTWRQKDTTWEVPLEIFQQADSPERTIQWQVVVTSTQVVEVNPSIETRTFTWRDRTPLPDGEAIDVAINPGDELQMLTILRGIGIYKSDNGGIDWRRVSNEPTLETLHIAPANPEIVYAGAFAKILKSEDGGEMWQEQSIRIDTQLHAAQIYAIVTDPDNANVVFAATDRGIVRSDDGGLKWVALLRGGNKGEEVLNRPFYTVVATRTPQGSRIYIAGDGNQIYWRSTNDTGSPWQRQICNACTPPIFALAVDPQDSSKLLAGSDEGSLVLSLNGGNDWKRTTIPLPSISKLKFSVMEFNPADSQIVYAGSGTHRSPSDGEGLYRSLDGGLTWQRFNTWASDGGSRTYIQGIALTPANSQVILIAGSPGVFRSDDGGNSWIKQ